jgi:VWFA-related protein
LTLRAGSALLILVSATPLFGEIVVVQNAHGGVTVQVVPGNKVELRRKSLARLATVEDARIVKQDDLLIVRAEPKDGAQMDLEVDVPYGVPFRAETTTGPVKIHGLVLNGQVVTESGAITLEAPWGATRLRAKTTKPPAQVNLPEGFKFHRQVSGKKEEPYWSLLDRLDGLEVTYGRIAVGGKEPKQLTLVDIPIPADSPIKMPWQAPAVIQSMLAQRSAAKAAPAGAKVAAATPEDEKEGVAVFRSDVRVVALSVAVTSKSGKPVPMLKPEDFEVLEDGVPQEVRFAGAEEIPFNLAILLDLSGSTQNQREAMREATKRFIGIARPQDQIALYALANNWFYVVTRLTKDRAKMEGTLDIIPDIGGASPVYDSIALAYAEEFMQRVSERNALIVITDGVDNQIQGVGVPSEVAYGKLRQAAEGMNCLIYPIFLDPYDKAPPPGWAKKAKLQMEGLASASGGRLFTAHSIKDLEPVYPQVADELRSVYSLSYSPKNQDFNGAWRKITVRVKKDDAKVRSRSGYFAR